MTQILSETTRYYPKKVAVRIKVCATCPGLSPGLALRNSATAPATWGTAIDVPLNVVTLPPKNVEVTPFPGATTNQLKRLLPVGFEKSA
ncbi:MAG: hypothetical protein AAF289_20755, partial [Cyanobacteria bacterium P01_A01_bin.135]